MKRAATYAISCVLVGCSGRPDAEGGRVSAEVETQLAAARNATIPSGLNLTSNSGPTRQDSSVSAGWSFELPTAWEAYASQTEATLRRGGYEAVRISSDTLVFAKHIPGDSYRVQVSREGSTAVRVIVSFSASPD